MQSLARVPFFKDFTDLDFERFDRRCTWRRYDEGEIVVDYEDETSDVYFIIAGEVRILIRTQAGKEMILAEMRAGQFFGELSAIDGTKRSANVTALTRAELCIMPASVFREIIFASPTVCDRVLRLLTARVRELQYAAHRTFDLRSQAPALFGTLAHGRIRGRASQESAQSRRRLSIMCLLRGSVAGASR